MSLANKVSPGKWIIGICAVLAAAALTVGLVGWVRSGGSGSTDDEAAVQINYVPPLTDAELGTLTIAARRPGQLIELADLATLDGETRQLDRQEPSIPTLPDIAATPVGLVMVDGQQAVLLNSGDTTPTAAADAVVWAGGSWVWHIRGLDDAQVEATLVDVETGETRGEPVRADLDAVVAAPGLGLIVDGTVHGVEPWDLGELEVIAGSEGGVLASDGQDYVVVKAGESERLVVAIPAAWLGSNLVQLSPDLSRVVALDRDAAAVVVLTDGSTTSIEPAVANPLRYSWSPDSRLLVWMEEGRVYRLDSEAGETVDLGPATVAISYGAVEVMVDEDLG